MKKQIITLVATAMFCGVTFAQKFQKLYYKDVTKEIGDISFKIDNAVSTDGETKFKLKITNKSANFIIYKPTESKFVINGKESKPSEKNIIINPNASTFVTINLKGTGYNEVKNYSYVIDGLYSVSTSGDVVKTDNFKLPPAKNDFKTGDFTCTMTGLVKETDKTEVKFKCAYNGNKVGIINGSKASIKMPDGNEYANAKKPGLLDSKTREVMLMKGDEETVTLKWDRFEGGKKMDMQKVIMEIVWNETFSESPLVKEKGDTIELEFDEAVTTAKNK